MKWFLDDGPFGLLAREFNAAWEWPASTLCVVEDVARASVQDKSGRRAKLLAMAHSGQPSISVHAMPSDSAVAEMVFDYLRPNATSATKDMGEHVSIAMCALEETEAVFVTCDKGAAYLALSELGPGRVAPPFELWYWLATEGLLSAAACDTLCQATLKADPNLPGVPKRLSGRGVP